MVRDRNLYHYCSNESFFNIIKSRKIRLSSLSLSNDSSEGKVIFKRLKEIATDHKLKEEQISGLINSIHLNHIFEGLGFCLSGKPDILSQWRGYANNAQGVSIGFSKKYLEALADYYGSTFSGFRLYEVQYSKKKQKELLEPYFEKAKALIDKGALNTPMMSLLLGHDYEERRRQYIKDRFELNMQSLDLLEVLFILKSDAFKEENEWRLISFLTKGLESDDCSFLPIKDKLKPYRSFELQELNFNPIKKIILGPKNKTPDFVISKFLKQNGFKNVTVSRSKASYR